MNLKIVFTLLLAVAFWSCQDKATSDSSVPATPDFKNKAHELVYNMTQKIGDMQKLKDKKDVVYTYRYTTPDNKADISTEQYIFDGELSYAKYHQHERTLPTLEGPIEQGYDGQNFWLRHNGNYLEDEEAMKRVIFNRKTNFYWFCMMQKLMDPNLNYEYIKQDTVAGNIYDIVKVTFNSEDGKPTDIYQLYINQATSLVDQFLFTVVDFNVMETPFLLQMEYEEVGGILIPTKRRYTQANWDGENLNENWIQVSWTDIKFNNGLAKSIFERGGE